MSDQSHQPSTFLRFLQGTDFSTHYRLPLIFSTKTDLYLAVSSDIYYPRGLPLLSSTSPPPQEYIMVKKKVMKKAKKQPASEKASASGKASPKNQTASAEKSSSAAASSSAATSSSATSDIAEDGFTSLLIAGDLHPGKYTRTLLLKDHKEEGSALFVTHIHNLSEEQLRAIFGSLGVEIERIVVKNVVRRACHDLKVEGVATEEVVLSQSCFRSCVGRISCVFVLCIASSSLQQTCFVLLSPPNISPP